MGLPALGIEAELDRLRVLQLDLIAYLRANPNMEPRHREWVMGTLEAYTERELRIERKKLDKWERAIERRLEGYAR